MKKSDKIRIKILKTITAAACVGLMVGGSALDSKSTAPIIVVLACIAWLALMMVANWED